MSTCSPVIGRVDLEMAGGFAAGGVVVFVLSDILGG